MPGGWLASPRVLLEERIAVSLLNDLGRFAARRSRTVLAVWAVIVVGGFTLGGSSFDNTVTVDDAPVGSESMLAQARLDALDPEGELVVAVVAGEDFFAPDLVESASAVARDIRGFDGVVEVTDAYTAGGLIGS